MTNVQDSKTLKHILKLTKFSKDVQKEKEYDFSQIPNDVVRVDTIKRPQCLKRKIADQALSKQTNLSHSVKEIFQMYTRDWRVITRNYANYEPNLDNNNSRIFIKDSCHWTPKHPYYKKKELKHVAPR